MKEGDEVVVDVNWDGGAYLGKMNARESFTIASITQQDRDEAALQDRQRTRVATSVGSGPGNSPVTRKIDLNSEAGVRDGVTMVRSDLRTMATGLESYFVDWNAYPPQPAALTSPIAYLSREFGDPFDKDQTPLRYLTFYKSLGGEPSPQTGQSQPQVGKGRKGKKQGAARQPAQPKDNWWLAYSVGPDQIDDRGAIPYDPTNGTLSGGDIVREKQ